MPSTIQQLREQREALAKDVRHLMDEHKADWDKDTHGTQFDTLMNDVERLDDAIKREQRALDMEADRHWQDAVRDVGGTHGNIDDVEMNTERATFRQWQRGGENALNADQRAIMNTMSTGTGSEGGYTVPSEVVSTVLEALAQFGGMRQVATVIQTASGASIAYPTSDGTAEVGEIIAENQTATDADPVFGTLPLVVYKFSSKVVTVPFELLQDSAIDVEGFVNRRLQTRLGRATNNYYTVGTGTNQPTGIVTASGAGKVGTTGQTTSVIWEDIIDLQHSVDPAYRESMACRFMMHDSSLKVVRKLKDGNDRPLFLPSYDAGIRGGTPAELAGSPITINQSMPVMAANAKSILFGALGEYVIRDVMAMTMFRFTDSAYTKKGQVGFLAWMRSGGNLMDVGGAVNHYQNSAT